MVAHPRARPAPRRGARVRPLGQPPRGAPLHEPGRSRPEHHPHGALRHGDEPPRPRPALRAQPQRARGGGLRLRQDARVLRAQRHADVGQLPRDRPEGRVSSAPRAHARRRRLQGALVQHRGLLQVAPLQPHRLRAGRGRHPGVRHLPHRQHHRRQGARGRPLLGERRAAALRGAHRVPRLPLPAGGPLALRPRDATLTRQGQGVRRGLPKPARPPLQGSGDGPCAT